MWWLDRRSSFRGTAESCEPEIQKQPPAAPSGFRLSLRSAGKTARIAAILALAAVTAGCFQPLYGERTLTTGGSAIKE